VLKLLLFNFILKSRFMKIYTGTGDDGKTKLLGPRKFKKNSKIISALGEIDELNSFIGWSMCSIDRSTSWGMSVMETLDRVQEDLYSIGAELAGANTSKTSLEDVDWAERMIDKFWSQIKGPHSDQQTFTGKKVGKFVKPGERGELSARLHVCRAICRRTERSLYDLKIVKRLKYIRQYLNRLSDLLFAMSEC
jgi:cob(I)alamin adenosyltransferase